MHRSPLSVLVIFAAVAACSTHDNSEGTDLLSKDPTLVARLGVNHDTAQPAMPAACGTVAVAAQPAAANKTQAEKLTRQGSDAEILGNLQEAKSLLRRASDLDATNKAAAYHLARTNEALGDRTAAMTAYCRYLALTPTTSESAEARQRVAELSQSESHATTRGVGDSTPTRRRVSTATTQRTSRERAMVAPRVVARATGATGATGVNGATGATVEQSARVRSTARGTSSARGTASTSVSAVGVDDSQKSSEPVTTSREVEGTSHSTEAAGDVVATTDREPNVEQPSTAPIPARRGPSGVQSAGIGAAAGAILGAATGRSMKSAVIGAAAGGILGTIVGRSALPVGSGTFH